MGQLIRYFDVEPLPYHTFVTRLSIKNIIKLSYVRSVHIKSEIVLLGSGIP
jgi:hypothetical protein